METTLKMAGVLIPLVFAVAVLRFVHEALMPLVMPLLLVAAVACAWWFFGRPRKHPARRDDDHDRGYGPKLINDFALDFVTRHKGAPFFLYYPMILTHDPYQPTPDSPDWDPTANGENKQKNVKHFADMTAYMDKMIGRLDAKLGELGIRDNTLLLFIGDNGTGRGVTSRFKGADYPGGKGTTTARGYHVPFIASWPGVLKQGRVNSDLISSTDFLPTICAAAGIPVPANVDGVSFLPQLRGEKGTPREWLYCWYSPRQSADMTVREFAFTSDAKLYRTGDYFDLATDPEWQAGLP